MSSDRRFKPIGQGLFKGTDGIWKLPNGDIGASAPAPVVDLGPAGPRWSRGFISVSTTNTSWWRIAEGLGSSGRGNFMLTISGGGGSFTPSVRTYMIAKSWQGHANDVGITLLNGSPQAGDHTALRIDRDANGAYLDVQINAGASGGSMSYTIQDSNAGPAATRRWLALATPEESPATTATSTFDLTQFSRSHNDIVFGVFSQGMDSTAALGGLFIGGDSTGDGLVELAGDQMKLRFNPDAGDTVDLFHDGASLIWKGSNTTEAYRWQASDGTDRFLIQASTSIASNFLDVKRGGTFRVFNSDNADGVNIFHDGADFRLQDISGTSYFRLDGMGISIEDDSTKMVWGTGRDVSMNWGGSNFNMKNETTTNTSWQLQNTSGVNKFSFQFSTTASSNLLHAWAGSGFKVWDAGNTDAIALRHDGTDANFTFASTDHVTFSVDMRALSSIRVNNYIRFLDNTLTISGGVVTATKTRHKLETQSSASTDDLDTISGGQDNQLLILSAANSARTIQVTQAGNVALSTSPMVLNNRQDTLTLIYDSSAALWLELSRSDNEV